jgi:hypothetical protein
MKFANITLMCLFPTAYYPSDAGSNTPSQQLTRGPLKLPNQLSSEQRGAA